MNKYIHKYYISGGNNPGGGDGSDNPSDDQVTPSKPKYLTRKEAIIKGENLTPMSRAEAMLKKEDIPVFTRKEALTKELINGGSGSFETMDIVLENNSGIPFLVSYVAIYNNKIVPITYEVDNANDHLFSSVFKGSYIAFAEPVAPEYVTFYKYRYDEATDEDIYTEIEDSSQFDLMKNQNGKIVSFKVAGNYGEDEHLIVRITGK